MKLLLFDTSTSHFSLAVSDGDKILRLQNVVLERTLADAMVPRIKAVLAKAAVPLKKLDGFAVGLGPGSFTSLRVGLATVKALGFATGKPVVGIPSLDTLALNGLGQKVDRVCVLVDARRNLFYACLYAPTKNGLERESEYLLTPLNDLLPRLTGKILFIGDGIISGRAIIEQQAAISKKGKFVPIFADEKRWFPQAKNMLPLAKKRFATGDVDDVNKLLPLYLYPEDCQVTRK